MDEIKLIGLMYLLSFCSHLSALPINVTSEISMLIKRIIWTSRNQSNISLEFNPNAILNTPEMIRKAGYPAESHVVMTEDGYLLTLHRIPGGNDSLPVLLQHGLLGSSADWLVLGKDKAFAYLLADQGYDVWLGNFRGNIYSRAHVSLSPSNPTFWDFSYNEMGIYDSPAMITFITNMRSQLLHTYIGHSMGANSFFIMASERPEIAQMVQMMISLAPAIFKNHMQSPIQYFYPFKNEFKLAMQLFFHDEFLGDSVRFLLEDICDRNIEFCSNMLSMIWGDDCEQFNNTLLPVILKNFPAGSSTKTILHFIQPEMIRKSGYSAESHVVMTEDGYLLTLHRIPGGNDSLPVLLQHGFLSSSADWIVLGKGKALAYLLADQGYDVWLGNFRGNTYSKAHIFLSPLKSTFWNYSFHEMGIYDLPAMITFITNMRSQPLHTYIGHSMGTTSFFIMASERPKISKMVQMMVALAPAVLIKHMQSPVQYLNLIRSEIKTVMRLLFHDEFFQSDIVRFLLKKICLRNISLAEICSNFMFIIWGDDHEQFNNTLLPVILNHFPTSASTKTLLHYAQVFDSDKFRKYDYGRVKNLLIYNSMDPPNYDLSNITVPVALSYADNDWFISIEDVKRLYHLLPNVMDMYEVPWSKFNHMDFMWGKDASKLVYDRILKIMRGKNPKNVTSVNNIVNNQN
ncbi:lipase 3 isoform X2 [Camponotus floridanus]|uniref:lipase 3 isoform X2 n=1 Tax=Camponotus floridanus TaxID=104421 RepID=UPI000DC6A0E6|nr:lipase 3 isoform X2 [Camponotus floridanus]